MVEYAYDFNFEKCFVCRMCVFDLYRRVHYCSLSKEVIDNPHAGRCVNYQR